MNHQALANTTAANLAGYEVFRQMNMTQVKTFVTSRTGIIVSTINASASAFCSFFIIMLIIKSDVKLQTVYHRILFGMSLFDIIQSLAMALATLPMPSDMIYDQFEGLVAGTKTTCDIQGFLVIFGSVGSFILNAVLCIYYLLSICFQWKDERFRRYLESPLYAFALVSSLLFSCSATRHGQVNPSPVQLPFCIHSRYPWWCNDEVPICANERGSNKSTRLIWNLSKMLLFACAGTVILTMIIIICYVRNQENATHKEMATYGNDEVDGQSNDTRRSRQERNYQRSLQFYKKNMKITKDAITSALLYTLAFLCTWHYGLIRAFYPSNGKYALLGVLRVCLRPLQGVFNMIIFIHHKMRNIQTHRPQTSSWAALLSIFQFKNHPEYIVSNLTLVRWEECFGDVGIEGNVSIDENNFHSGCVSNLNDDRYQGQTDQDRDADLLNKFPVAVKEPGKGDHDDFEDFKSHSDQEDKIRVGMVVDRKDNSSAQSELVVGYLSTPYHSQEDSESLFQLSSASISDEFSHPMSMHRKDFEAKD